MLPGHDCYCRCEATVCVWFLRGFMYILSLVSPTGRSSCSLLSATLHPLNHASSSIFSYNMGDPTEFYCNLDGARNPLQPGYIT